MLKKARANYHHSIIESQGRNVISIVDLNQGGTCLTNDIENVVPEIARLHHINPAQYMIVYRDSDKTWDGWDHAKQEFIPLGATSEADAIRIYISKQVLTPG